MPKVLGGSSSTSLSKNSSGGILKRNQACHQCRRRKLKWYLTPLRRDRDHSLSKLLSYRSDANRPCSTCVRSHSYAIMHAQEGSDLPPNPECTFDDVSDTRSAPDASLDAQKDRYERLESRILELETLLRDKEDLIASLPGSSGNFAQPSASSGLATPLAVSLLNPWSFDAPGATDDVAPSMSDGFSVTGLFEGLIGGIPTELGVLWPKWSQHLPRPDLLRHIVDTFFAFQPHATRLFNMSTFLTSLSLPPDHPDFPSPPVLHAICAASSLFTVANRQQLGMSAADFAEQQVMYAKDQIDKHLMNGQKPLQCLQATVILSWYYWSHARWIELFVSTGQSLRIAVPLGLNLCAPFHALNTTAKSMSIMPIPLTLAEDETRRNVFWLAYAVDRQYGAGNGWAMSLDDNDIAQLLPLPKANLDAGIAVNAEHRQWSHLQQSYSVHPPGLTDSFTLYIKVMSIISRIKNFNHRFRVMEHLGDPGSQSTRMNRLHEPDIRSTSTFSQLDDLISSFRSSLSHGFKDPFVNNSIDPHLYTTHLALHASIILLHEPHSNAKSNICTSAMRILHAARGILDLVYVVLSTNYDLVLLDLFCPFCWFLAGRVFGRFLKAAQDANSIQQIDNLRVELEFVRTALQKMGEKVPLSARYQKMLDACVREVCGPSTTVTVPVNGIPVRTVADDFLLAHVTQDQTLACDLGTFLKLYNGFLEGV